MLKSARLSEMIDCRNSSKFYDDWISAQKIIHEMNREHGKKITEVRFSPRLLADTLCSVRFQI